MTAPLPAASAQPGSRRRARPIAALGLAAAAVITVAGVMLATRDDPPSAAHVAPPRALPNSLVEIDPATNTISSVTRVGRGPESIASTEDAMWVSNVGDSTVARLDLESRQVRIVGGAPVAHQLVSSLSGDVWLSSFEEPVVSLIAERGRIVEASTTWRPVRFRFGCPARPRGSISEAASSGSRARATREETTPSPRSTCARERSSRP